jgi:transposase
MATRAQWARWVGEWRQSGLTAEAFADRKGLRLPSLYEWSSRLGREARRAPPIVEVVALQPSSIVSPATFEISLPSGVRVGVPSGFALEDLQRLLAVLEER